jgi:hypothetical protein
VSDYDILVLTESTEDCDFRAKEAIEQACLDAGLSATPRFIYREIDFVNRKLEKGQYFFADINIYQDSQRAELNRQETGGESPLPGKA